MYKVIWKLNLSTVEPLYNEVLGTMKITLLYQVSHYIRVKKQRNIKRWDQQNYLVIRGFCYIRPRCNEVPLYKVIWKLNLRIQNPSQNCLKKFFMYNTSPNLKFIQSNSNLQLKWKKDICTTRKVTNACLYIMQFYQGTTAENINKFPHLFLWMCRVLLEMLSALAWISLYTLAQYDSIWI